MEAVVLVIHLLLAISIVGLVVIQKSEGGGLGLGGGSGGGGLGGLTTAGGTKNLLTRATAIAAACFFATSLLLGVMAGGKAKKSDELLRALDKAVPAIEQTQPIQPDTIQPETDVKELPSVPME